MKMKVVYKSTLNQNGGQYVTTAGTSVTRLSPVDNLATNQPKQHTGAGNINGRAPHLMMCRF